MIPTHKKIDLIYLTGCSRSGSTLLDLILSAHPRVVSVGEVCNHARWLENNFACTCGAKVRECEFWQRVAGMLRRDHLEARVTRINSQLEKLRALLGFAAGARFLPVAAIQKYGLASYHLFKAVREASGKSIVLDSSKIPLRLLYLGLSGYFNLRIIHLVRDGRAYLNSTSKRAEKPAQGGWIPPVNAWRSTLRWMSTNSLSRYITTRLPDTPSHLVKYEELASNPAAAVQRLCEALQLDYHRDMLQGAGAAAHNISGSRWRYQADRVIRLDESWRTELARHRLLVFELLGRRMNRRFGYR